jgi:hypothetical protein
MSSIDETNTNHLDAEYAYYSESDEEYAGYSPDDYYPPYEEIPTDVHDEEIPHHIPASAWNEWDDGDNW